MIIYDSKKWYTLFTTLTKTYKSSYNQKLLVKFIGIVSVYASAVTVANLLFLNGKYTIEPMFFSLLGVILSLFLVFRLNSAYDRWWEGRKQWGKLVNDSRTLCMNLHTLIPLDNKRRRKFFVSSIANFCIALQWHLRKVNPIDNLIFVNRKYMESLENVDHVPNQIAAYMFEETETMYQEKQITDFDKQQIKTLLQGFVDVLGACERIKKTPIPFSHSTFIKLFILVYIFILPFGLVNVFGYLTVPAVMVMAFAMAGIEIISEEIEDPFGVEANNLPTGLMSDTIRENVYEILHVKSNFTSLGKFTEDGGIVS